MEFAMRESFKKAVAAGMKAMNFPGARGSETTIEKSVERACRQSILAFLEDMESTYGMRLQPIKDFKTNG